METESEVAKNEGDRRVQRTRRLLQEAFIEVILEKGYEAVTIQDILDRADVGRSTFYAHYLDKDDLLSNHFEGLHKAFEAHAELGKEVDLLMIILKQVKDEHRLYKALLGKKSGRAMSHRMHEFLLESIRNIMQNQVEVKLAAYQFEAVAQYLASALLALIAWWVDSDLPCSIEELYALIMRLVNPGLEDVIQTTLSGR